MASLNMPGPYDLNTQMIDAQVTKTQAGNCVLGTANDNGGIVVSYVGRDDKSVNARLKQRAGKKTNYTHFKSSYASSPKAAFEEECRNYHDWDENKIRIRSESKARF